MVGVSSHGESVCMVGVSSHDEVGVSVSSHGDLYGGTWGVHPWTTSYFLLDNNYEIGEEPENTWGWGKCKKSRPQGTRGKRASRKETGGWISKKRKLDSMIEHCSDILKKAGHGGSGRVTSLDGNDCDEEEQVSGKVINCILDVVCDVDYPLPRI